MNFLNQKFKTSNKIKKEHDVSIIRKNISVCVRNKKIEIYLNGDKITQDVGFTTSLLVLQRWHDSTQAQWKVFKLRENVIKIFTTWKKLPLVQIWYLTITDNNEIRWKVILRVEEPLKIDKRRAGLMLERSYSKWTNSFESGKFNFDSTHWQKIKLSNPDHNRIKVIKDLKGSMKTLGFDFSNNHLQTKPLIQNAPKEYQVGVVQAEMPNTRGFSPGEYEYFTSRLKLKEKDKVKIVKGEELKRRKVGCKNGNIELRATLGKLDLYWKNERLTQEVGLNTSILALERWFDSSNANWEVRKIDENSIKVITDWWELPLKQIWNLKIVDGEYIRWKVDFVIEEELKIEEQRIGVMLNKRYKRWINSHEEGKFSRASSSWKNINLNYLKSNCVGVKGGNEENVIPSLFFNFDNKHLKTFPLIQNPPKKLNARMLHARIFDRKVYEPKKYFFFTGKIWLSSNEEEVESHIEKLREKILIEERKKKNEKDVKVLLANIPWKKNGRIGVRAGSRWPHLKDYSTEKEYLPFPFFLAYSAALLKKNNINVSVLDSIAKEQNGEQFLRDLQDIDPHLLVAEVSTVSLQNDLRILKRVPKEIKIALCGPESNIRKPSFLKKYPFIDFVMVGEYEYTLLELVKYLEEGDDLNEVQGLIYRKREEIKINPSRPLCNLNEFPWPLREEFPMYKYWDLPGNIPHPSAQMLASRGCPFGCDFCLWPQLMYDSSKYRSRNPIDVVDEMEFLVRQKGFKSIYFDDDTFNIGKKRIISICKEKKERGLKNLPWAAMARPDLMDKELLQELKSAGLWALKYGVESADQQLLNNCGKNMELEKSERMIKYTKKLGIKVHLTFTFGLPGETEETIKKSINKALELDPLSVQFSINTPYPGTKYFKELNKKGQILTKDWSKYDGNYGSVIKTDNLSAFQLQKAKEKAYRQWGNHLKERETKWNCSNILQKFKFYFLKTKYNIYKYGMKYALMKIKDFLSFKSKKFIIDLLKVF